MSNFSLGSFPNTRLRRNRKASWVRDLIASHNIVASDLILPLFVIEGQGKKEAITNLPGVYRLSIDLILEEVKKARMLGIKAVMLFPVIDQKLKTNDGKEALNKNNLICRTVKEIKDKVPNIGVICDVALDPYTSHGHDGVIDKNGKILNDDTVKLLCKQALVQVKAGCDIIAPSDMMDGRVEKIRQTLDDNGFLDVSIMAYSVKYASNFYGPFRQAVGSVNNLKFDKKTYQMDYRRDANEALKEVALDIEGADVGIIKPGMPYLDIISDSAKNFSIPIIAYQVSGEYAMLKFAAENGVFDFEKALLESLISFKRAGCQAIISYGAIKMAENL